MSYLNTSQAVLPLDYEVLHSNTFDFVHTLHEKSLTIPTNYNEEVKESQKSAKNVTQR